MRSASSLPFLGIGGSNNGRYIWAYRGAYILNSYTCLAHFFGDLQRSMLMGVVCQLLYLTQINIGKIASENYCFTYAAASYPLKLSIF